MNAVDNVNESELVYGMVILTTAWTECKTSCERQYCEMQGKVTHIYFSEGLDYPSRLTGERGGEKKNKADGFLLTLSSDFARIEKQLL